MTPGHARRRGSKPTAAAGPAYALDGVTGDVLACSFRRLRSDYFGSVARLRRDSDNAVLEVSAVGEEADVAGVVAWAAGANLFLVRWYLQDGSGNYIQQTTASLQPGVVVSGGKLRMRKTSSQWMALPSSLTLTDGVLFLIAKHTSTALFYNVVLGDIMAYRYFFIDSTVVAQNVGCSGGLLSPIRGANESVTTFSQVTISQTDYVRLDGTALTLTATGSPSLSNLTRMGDGGGVSGAFDCSELILFSTKPGDAVRDALESNQAAYWGTPQ